MKQQPILQVSNLTKVYGREINLGLKKFGKPITGAQNVSFSVSKGVIFGFLGPNGAGKTTVMRSILNYLKIQEGEIIVFDQDHRKDALEIRKKIGYIPGDLAVYDNFTGDELLKYFNHFRPHNTEFLEELKTIFTVNLKQKTRTLSSGNRQQVGIILALASKPEFLILDEPSSGLDPLITAKFHKLLKRLKKEGVTIFLSSHDLTEVQAICDRVGIIKNGEMVLVEEIENLRRKFLQNVFVRFSSSKVPKIEEIKELTFVLEVNQENNGNFKLKIKENINELLNWLSKYKIERLSIEDSSLEEIFLHYYD
ncbi:MAG: ABC transporter ATP-binding protein [Candidatus Heimdallarchaeota archaeon]|nr:ABC transporter ATP-binding protein [Candidatus Heimdallarchaeota archaeon]